MQTINRPTPVLIIAIFHFIVGGTGLLCDLCGVASLVAGGGQAMVIQPDPKQAKMQQDMQEAMAQKIPGYQASQIVNTFLSLTFDVVLLAAGYGLLHMAPWARTLSLVYASVSLLHKIVMAFYTIFLVLPAMDGVFSTLLGQAQTAQERQILEIGIMSGKIGGVAGVCITMIYPFVVLLVLNLASVKEAFSGQPLAPADRPNPDYQDPFRPGSGPPDYDDRIQR